MKPVRVTAVIKGKRYSTDTSTVLAQGQSESVPQWLPQDAFAFLFRGVDGRYFAQFLIPPHGHSARFWVEPLSELEAIPFYWELPDKDVTFEEAFPATPK